VNSSKTTLIFTAGLIDLYESFYDFRWIQFATELAHQAIEKFMDADGNLFLAPPISPTTSSAPAMSRWRPAAPGSILLQSLLRLAAVTVMILFRVRAELGLTAISNMMAALLMP